MDRVSGEWWRGLHWLPESLSDVDRSTVVNDLRPSASFSARKSPQRIPYFSEYASGFSGPAASHLAAPFPLVTNGDVGQVPGRMLKSRSQYPWNVGMTSTLHPECFTLYISFFTSGCVSVVRVPGSVLQRELNG